MGNLAATATAFDGHKTACASPPFHIQFFFLFLSSHLFDGHFQPSLFFLKASREKNSAIAYK